MSDTRIEWADKVWNPLRGCSKVSEGCRNCYAIKVAHRFSGEGQPFEGLAERTPAGINWTGKVKLVPEKLDEPLKWKRPAKIFVNSMSDLFHENVPEDYIRQVFEIMGEAQQHTFQVLTKRPERMMKVLNGFLAENDFATLTGSSEPPFPWPNVWIGVSVENQQAADERIPLLLQTPAAVRFLSCEPLLGQVNLPWLKHGLLDKDHYNIIDWVIVGGESGPKARPMHPEWARSLRDQCNEWNVPFFFKQWGEIVVPSQMTPELYYEIEHFGDGIGISDGYRRVGKKRAGRLLYGREWNEFPEVQQ